MKIMDDSVLRKFRGMALCTMATDINMFTWARVSVETLTIVVTWVGSKVT